VAFRHAPAQLLAGPGTAIEVTRDAEDVAGVALACELVGTAEAALDLASAYARTRMQFGRPIGSFQAVKHHCADMLLRVELTRTAALHAAESVADGASTARQRTRAALLARAYAADAAYACAATSLQVHGGIGFTWEHTAHLHLKRTQSARHLLGSPAEAKARLAALLDLTPG
jgi:alkylation response protein AidB-like acyl-CoA dehydrogenase